MARGLLRTLLSLAIGFNVSLSTATRNLQQAPGLSASYELEFPFYPVREIDFNHVITLKAPDSVGSSRASVSLTVVLDRSGSMRGDKINLLKKSTEFLVTQLKEGDSFGVVSFSSRVTEDIPLTKVTSAFQSQARSSIQRINASGGTNLSGGLFRGIQQQKSGDTAASTVKVVVIFTDGLANIGTTRITDITARLGRDLTGSNPPTIYALGFGGNHDGQFLQAIAEAGQGSYVFIRDESVIASTFGVIIGGILSTTAQGIKVTLVPDNGARITSVKGGTVSPSSNTWITEFPNLFAEERRDILVGMKAPATSGEKSEVVLRVKVTYFDVIARRSTEANIDVVLRRRRTVIAKIKNPLVEVTDLRFKASEDIASAVTSKQNGDSRGATATLDRTLSELNSSSNRGEAEVQALIKDVEKAKQEVSGSGSLTRGAVNSLSSGGTAIASQRAVGSASSGFASAARVSSNQRAASSAAVAFVGPG